MASVAVRENHMRHTPLFPILVFVAGLATGFLKDIEVTLSPDLKATLRRGSFTPNTSVSRC